jgi:hypothetical protein
VGQCGVCGVKEEVRDIDCDMWLYDVIRNAPATGGQMPFNGSGCKVA